MKVLLLNTYDSKGGAARATRRLLEGLRASEVDQHMLVQSGSDLADDITMAKRSVWPPFIRPYLDYLQPLVYTRKRTTFFPAMLSDNLEREINLLNPDIVHLNWISEGFIKIETLAKINKPLVWTLQDMWAFTGGCHYTDGCTRFTKQCGHCPILNSSKENDLSRKVFKRKLNTFKKVGNINLVAPSRWMAENIRKSSLMGHFPVDIIPNGLDTSAFQPVEREAARQRLGLKNGKKYILFGAIDPAGNKLKGFNELRNSIDFLDDREIEFIVFGSKKKISLPGINRAIHSVGWIGDENDLAILYSAADVMVVPSLQEAFGQTASEALACGTPVVAFEKTGVADIVEHKKSGFLAEPFDSKSLAEGINWILEDDQRLKSLSKNARERAVKKFDIKVVTDQYVSLYKKILSSQPNT